MEEQEKKPYKPSAIKLCSIALLSLLLLIPLVMVQNTIEDRGETKNNVETEISNSSASQQQIAGPLLFYVRDSAINLNYVLPEEQNYDSKIETETLHRSIYDVVVYNSLTTIDGTFKITKELLGKKWCYIAISISDLKGLQSIPEMEFCNSTYTFELDRSSDIRNKTNFFDEAYIGHYSILKTKITLPDSITEGQELSYKITLKVKGTKEHTFVPCATMTTLNISSTHPHPSFTGSFLPEKRIIADTGFSAAWSVLGINVSVGANTMGVKFVNPSDPYLQSERTSKYGFLIIVLMFTAAILAEFTTRKEINIVQYAIVGLSLILFYSLLMSFSEITAFWFAYLIAALMTCLALTFYFKRMLKTKVAYILGGFVAFMYTVNYVIIQMDTFAFLTGSLLLFVMLLALMYFTSNMNNLSIKQNN